MSRYAHALIPVLIVAPPPFNRPQAVNDTVTIQCVTGGAAPVDVDVLANDIANGGTLVLTAVSVPTVGSATIVNNKIRYTPPENYDGTISVVYSIANGFGTADGQLLITLRPIVVTPIPDFEIMHDWTQNYKASIIVGGQAMMASSTQAMMAGPGIVMQTTNTPVIGSSIAQLANGVQLQAGQPPNVNTRDYDLDVFIWADTSLTSVLAQGWKFEADIRQIHQGLTGDLAEPSGFVFWHTRGDNEEETQEDGEWYPVVATTVALNRDDAHTINVTSRAPDSTVYNVQNDNMTYDCRGKLFTAGTGATGDGLRIQQLKDNTMVTGGTCIGNISRMADKEVIKASHDKNAVTFDRDGPFTGAAVLENFHMENYEDGFSLTRVDPTDGPTHAAIVRGCSFNWIRDENEIDNPVVIDGSTRLADLTFEDCLIEGLSMGLGARPGQSFEGTLSGKNTIKFINCCWALSMKPGSGFTNPDKAVYPGSIVTIDGIKCCCAHLFKYGGKSGQMIMENTIILVPWHTFANSNSPMSFPGTADYPDASGFPSSYKNVILVWLGNNKFGKYPGLLPASGVTVTNDINVWLRARERWLVAHGCEANTAYDSKHYAGVGDYYDRPALHR